VAAPGHRAGANLARLGFEGLYTWCRARTIAWRRRRRRASRPSAAAQRADRAQRDRPARHCTAATTRCSDFDRATPAIEGRCDARFAALREAFSANFAELDEVGAGVCVQIDGTAVVDLWGGHRDARARSRGAPTRS
jgi:hypothetical protein